MQVQGIMQRNVAIADPNMTIRDVAMRADNISLRVGEHGRLIGIVTDRDIVMRGVATNRAPGNTTEERLPWHSA
ncbi:CBS domain-containing protein [Bradyrhizobium diazoefficiens]|nr:CBS domain-containing protein [Bradyrhizobium diazoefficiens]QQO24390.1 CBS domain-containing protein [Bradyrhizobium diazoefficiens]